MKSVIPAFLVVGCLAVSIASPPSRAFNVGDVAIVAQVPFEFTVAEQSCPAGPYRLGHRVGSIPSIQFERVEGAKFPPLLAIARLARQRAGNAPKAGLVFEKIGDRYYLAEVWLPGLDGFRVRATDRKHERAIVDAKG